MKFLSNRAMALVIVSSSFLLAMTSCKKSSSGGGTGFSATINGSAWTPTANSTGIVYETAGDAWAIVGAQVKSGDTAVFTIEFFGPITLNHPMSTDTTSLDLEYADSKTGGEYAGGNGFGHALINITSYDANGHKIAGNFSGVMYNVGGGSDSLVVTNGSFNQSFSVQP